MQYHLAFSTDSNYLPYLLVLCQSILDHIEDRETNAQDSLVFNVLVDQSINLSEAQKQAEHFTKRNQSHGLPCTFVWHVLNADDFSDCNKLYRDNNVAYSTYYRLHISNLLPSDVTYLAYLDIDMLVLTDIRDLFLNNNLDGFILGAVSDPGLALGNSKNIDETNLYLHYKADSSKTITIPLHEYFNAGMLLINLKEWRKHNISEIGLKEAPLLDLPTHDQDLLNYICQGKIKLLSWGWNYQTPMFYMLYNPKSERYDISCIETPDLHLNCAMPSAAEFEQVSAAPYIVHFNTFKPWMTGYLKVYTGFGVPPSARLLYYRNLWLKLSQVVPEFTSKHLLNVDAINADTMKLLSINRKRKKDRKILVGLIGLSLVINLITLISSLIS